MNNLAEFRADRERYYYLVRSWHHLPKTEVVERAARMIFLNKTASTAFGASTPEASSMYPSARNQTWPLRPGKHFGGKLDVGRCHLATQDFRDTLNEPRRGDFVLC